MDIRIGFGLDVHQLDENMDFWIGGIQIPHHKGAVGHSDADVLIHAICDALLGAANLGDIGSHFPDTDPEYKNIDSKILLRRVVGIIKDEGYKINNIDTTIVLQKPKISPYIDKMKESLSEAMSLSKSLISIKATTSEKLGPEGREEGVSAYAVTLIQKV